MHSRKKQPTLFLLNGTTGLPQRTTTSPHYLEYEDVGDGPGVSAKTSPDQAPLSTEARFAVLFNCTPDMKILYRREAPGRFVTEVVNRVAAERLRNLSGKDSAHFVGKGLEEVLSAAGLAPEAIEARRSMYEKAIRVAEPLHFARQANSVREPAEMSVYPILNENGRCTHLLWRGRMGSEEQATAALQESEERYALVVKATNDGIFDWNLLTKNSYLSPRFKAMLGYQDDELSDDPWTFANLVHPEDRPALDEALARVDQDLDVDGFVDEMRLRCKDGSYRWIVARSHVVRTMDGKPSRIVGSTLDITERLEAASKLASSERRLRDIFDALFGFVGIFTLDGILVEANRSPFEGAGYPEEQVLGKFFWEIYWSHNPAEQIRLRDFVRRAANGEVVRYETTARMHDGQEIVVDSTLGQLRNKDGEVINVIAFGIDITRRREAEAQLIAAKQAAEAGSLAKSQFLSNMSHEIRTPMNAIIGLSEVLLDSELNDYQRECLTCVKIGGETLLAIISDILDISKLQAGTMALHRHHFWLRDLVNGVIARYAATAHSKNLKLTCEVAPSVPEILFGDAECIRQVLMNMVSNAVKFTTLGEIALLVGTDGAGEQCLHFTVRDTGKGVPADQQAVIFEPFSQVDGSSRRKHSGTGLGLAISAQLIELMNGRIWIESDGSSGSAFHFAVELQPLVERTAAILPAHHEHPPAPAAEPLPYA